MATEVTMHEAKTHFSKLVRLVEAGEEVIVRRGKDPVAKLVPYEKPARVSAWGSMKGRIWMAEDWDEPLEDFAGYM